MTKKRSSRGNGAAADGAPIAGVAATPGIAAVQSAITVQAPALPACDMPPGFEMRETGLFKMSKEGTWYFIAAAFEVLAESRPEDHADWGLLLRWRDRDGRAHEWIMPRRLLAGDATDVRAHLVAHGLRIGASRAAREALVDFLNGVGSPARVRTVPRTGWFFPAAEGAAPCFVLPGRTIGDTAGERVLLDVSPPPAMYRGRGTLDGWRDGVAARAPGNIRLILALSCAFAAPLLGLLGDEGGGVHLRGPSSKGKTTLINAAASAWGAPGGDGPHSFVERWHATPTALETAAAAHNDTLLPLDELSEADPVRLTAAIYMLMNGSGKLRGTAGGGNRPLLTWRTLVLSCGEESPAQASAQIGRHAKAGAETRLLDVPVEVEGGYGVFETLHDAPSGAALSRALHDAVQANHGIAGPAFVEWLVARRQAERDYVAATLAPRLRAILDAIAPAGGDGQVQRAARRLAVIALGGELASDAGITGWAPGVAQGAAATILHAWIRERGGTGALEDYSIAAALRRFIAANWRSRFEMLRAPDEDAAGAQTDPPLRDARSNGPLAGWKWDEVSSIGERHWLFGIVPETFDVEIAAPLGMGGRDARARLHRLGLLRAAREGGKLRLTCKLAVPGFGHPRLVVTTPGVLDGDMAEGNGDD